MTKIRAFSSLTLAIATAAMLAACSNPEMARAVARPGKYQGFSCVDMNKRGQELAARQAELQALINRAGQGAGGQVAIAIAYQSEFNQVRGDLAELESSAADSRCVLTHHSVSDQLVR